ncbi:MAG: hypothetical protein WCO53_10305 [Deltaproteobacteria bacterium]
MGGYSGSTEDKKIYDLTDVVEDAGSSNKLNEEVIKRATEIAERIVREIMPEIAAKVIREEIEKIKKMSDKGSANNI